MALPTKSNSEEKRSDLCRFLGKSGLLTTGTKKIQNEKQNQDAVGIHSGSCSGLWYLHQPSMENVEALASYEVDRPDCEYAEFQDCEMFVIYADGNWGLDVLKNHKKKPGWG